MTLMAEFFDDGLLVLEIYQRLLLEFGQFLSTADLHFDRAECAVVHPNHEDFLFGQLRFPVLVLPRLTFHGHNLEHVQGVEDHFLFAPKV